MTRYTNYVMKNNVFAELEAPIGSLATTIQLKEGQGARWGNEFPILATLESFDNDGKCTKREIVRITAVSGDNLTVVRGVAPCPSSDDSNSQGTTTYSFQADDKISLYITKEHFDVIDESVNDIYTNGVNKLRTEVVSGLQISVGAGPVLVGSSYYDFAGGNLTLTNNATNYVEIDEDGTLVSNTTGWTEENSKVSKVVTSGGAITSIEDWRLGTVGGKIGQQKIHELTEKEVLSPDDEFLVADSDNIYQNKKVKYSSFGGTLSSSSNIMAGEDLSEGDTILNTSRIYSDEIATQTIDFGGANSKLAIKQLSNGSQISTVALRLKGTSGSTATGLTLNIESDNNGKPSGTALSTQDIIADFQSPAVPFSFSDGTNTLAPNSGYTDDVFYVLTFSADGTHFHSTYVGSVYANVIYSTTTPFQFSNCAKVSMNTNSLGEGIKLIDSRHIISTVMSSYSGVAYCYTMSADRNNASLTSTTKEFFNGYRGKTYCRTCSPDGTKYFAVGYNSNSDYTQRIRRGHMTTPFNLTTCVEDGTATTNLPAENTGNFYLTEKYLVYISGTNNANPITYYYKELNSSGFIDDGTFSTSTFSITNIAYAGRYSVSYDLKHLYSVPRPSSGTRATFYEYRNAVNIDTNLSTKTFNVETPTTVNSGSTYRITLTPTGGSGNRFSYAYVNVNTTKNNLSLYDGTNRTDDTTKYPYALTEATSGEFYLKANVNNITPNKRCMIINKDIPAMTNVNYDFMGISKHFTGLTPGAEYFMSSTPGQITTSAGNIFVGRAVDSTGLLLNVEKKSVVAGDQFSVFASDYSYGMTTTETLVQTINNAPVTGTYKVSALMSLYGNSGVYGYIKIYANGVLKGTISRNISQQNISVRGSANVSINKGDKIEIKCYASSQTYVYLGEISVSYSVIDYNDTI